MAIRAESTTGENKSVCFGRRAGCRHRLERKIDPEAARFPTFGLAVGSILADGRKRRTRCSRLEGGGS
jgi:hypothetical protein